jgi:ribosomal protein S18 acetylase RimI-like enzyme
MTLRPLQDNEIREAIEVAARAFYDDPLFVHVHPDPDRRLDAFAREHRAYVRHMYRPYGVNEVAEADGRVVGLALWLPPGVRPPAWRDLLTLPALARSVGLRRLLWVLQDYRAFDAVLPEAPHWYLGLLAVDPEAQGRGVGGALVRRGLARADRDGVGTFLETGTETNVAFYERLGFRVTGPIPLPHGPTHWAMWRDPAR